MGSLAGFGLGDFAMSSKAEVPPHENRYLSDVVLPSGLLEPVLVGEASERSRVHSGYQWPRDANIPVGRRAALRRLPIPMLWNLITENLKANEPRVRWRLERGGELSTASLLAKHCRRLIDVVEPADNARDVCICIPSGTTESAQDYLLTELRHEGIRDAQLLWRDIAAMFAGINEGFFKDLSSAMKALNVLVIHAGIDQMEVSLRQVSCEREQGESILVPERRLGMSESCGSLFGLTASLVPTLVGREDLSENARWKMITSSEKFWRVLLNRSAEEEEFVHLDSWQTITLQGNAFSDVLRKGMDGALAGDSWLSRLVNEGTAINDELVFRNLDDQKIGPKIDGAVKRFAHDGIDRIILSGCMLENPAIRQCIEDRVAGIGSVPLLRVTEGNLCSGANEYLRRLRNGLPTYYDHLQTMGLLVTEGVKLKWFDLIPPHRARVRGGSSFSETIRNRISIGEGEERIEVSLRASSGDSGYIRAGRDVAEDFVFDSNDSSLPEYEKCYLRCLAREIIRPTEQDKSWIKSDQKRESYQNQILLELRQPSEWNKECRTLPFELPHKAPTQTQCNLLVQASAASGRARLTLTTVNSDFARHRKFDADYSLMEQKTLKDLPGVASVETGWPQLLEVPLFPFKYEFHSREQAAVDAFLACSSNSDSYLSKLKAAVNGSFKSAKYRAEIGRWAGLYNPNGIASGPHVADCVAKIANKISEDFAAFKTFEERRKLLTQAGYLFTKCPAAVKQFAFDNIGEFAKPYYQYLFGAFCKIITHESEFAIAFDTLYKCIEYNRSIGKSPLSDQSISGLLFLLRYRRNSENALSASNAFNLCGLLVEEIAAEISEKNIKRKFYNGVLTLLYLLRVRRAVPSFLSPDSPAARDLIGKLDKIERDGYRHSRDADMKTKIKTAIEGIRGYVEYRPDHSLIASFLEEAEKPGDDED